MSLQVQGINLTELAVAFCYAFAHDYKFSTKKKTDHE